jgi:hypothetical protein
MDTYSINSEENNKYPAGLPFDVRRSSSSDVGDNEIGLLTRRNGRQKQFLQQTASIDEETSEDNEGK